MPPRKGYKQTEEHKINKAKPLIGRISPLKGKPCLKRRRRAKFICLYCKKEFELPRCRLKRNQKFCNQRCRIQYDSLNSLSKLRRNGATQREAYKSPFYKDWRNTVFARDKYTCRWCKTHSGNGKDVYLEAHHIKAWKDYPELRFEVRNGLTLCLDCHNTTRGDVLHFVKKGV